MSDQPLPPWSPGQCIAALDHKDAWHPAKVLRVDSIQQRIRVHFQGWSSYVALRRVSFYRKQFAARPRSTFHLRASMFAVS